MRLMATKYSTDELRLALIRALSVVTQSVTKAELTTALQKLRKEIEQTATNTSSSTPPLVPPDTSSLNPTVVDNPTTTSSTGSPPLPAPPPAIGGPPPPPAPPPLLVVLSDTDKFRLARAARRNITITKAPQPVSTLDADTTLALNSLTAILHLTHYTMTNMASLVIHGWKYSNALLIMSESILIHIDVIKTKGGHTKLIKLRGSPHAKDLDQVLRRFYDLNNGVAILSTLDKNTVAHLEKVLEIDNVKMDPQSSLLYQRRVQQICEMLTSIIIAPLSLTEEKQKPAQCRDFLSSIQTKLTSRTVTLENRAADNKVLNEILRIEETRKNEDEYKWLLGFAYLEAIIAFVWFSTDKDESVFVKPGIDIKQEVKFDEQLTDYVMHPSKIDLKTKEIMDGNYYVFTYNSSRPLPFVLQKPMVKWDLSEQHVMSTFNNYLLDISDKLKYSSLRIVDLLQVWAELCRVNTVSTTVSIQSEHILRILPQSTIEHLQIGTRKLRAVAFNVSTYADTYPYLGISKPTLRLSLLLALASLYNIAIAMLNHGMYSYRELVLDPQEKSVVLVYSNEYIPIGILWCHTEVLTTPTTVIEKNYHLVIDHRRSDDLNEKEVMAVASYYLRKCPKIPKPDTNIKWLLPLANYNDAIFHRWNNESTKNKELIEKFNTKRLRQYTPTDDLKFSSVDSDMVVINADVRWDKVTAKVNGQIAKLIAAIYVADKATAPLDTKTEMAVIPETKILEIVPKILKQDVQRDTDNWTNKKTGKQEISATTEVLDRISDMCRHFHKTNKALKQQTHYDHFLLEGAVIPAIPYAVGPDLSDIRLRTVFDEPFYVTKSLPFAQFIAFCAEAELFDVVGQWYPRV